MGNPCVQASTPVGSLVCRDVRNPGLLLAIRANEATVEWRDGSIERAIFWALNDFDGIIADLERSLANAYRARERAVRVFGPRIRARP